MKVEDLMVGDTVRLTCGGQLMTVGNIDMESEEVDCIWISQAGELQREGFDAACLKGGRE